MTTLAADHEACAEVLGRSGSNFALPIRLLPETKRRGTTALYAFCRRADDIVDDGANAVEARDALDTFDAELSAALAGGKSADPVIRAVVDTVRRFAVPVNYLHDIIAGCRMDLDRNSYDTFSELEEYCRRVASAVGLAAIHIWGFRSPREALPAAHACGLAFQLTNILRDIPEDLARGRIYLPEADFRASDCSTDDLRAGRIGSGFVQLANMNAARAADCYRQAARLDELLSTDGRIVFRAMYGGYRSLFAAVQKAGTRIFTERVRPSRLRIIASTVAGLALGPRPPLDVGLRNMGSCRHE